MQIIFCSFTSNYEQETVGKFSARVIKHRSVCVYKLRYVTCVVGNDVYVCSVGVKVYLRCKC